ncbi:BREX system Lon protease-like protein BrxL [Allochromatium palmeri]|uniref:BREX system Lon protease-like protein BrxL n=1 Tax=Allochromatium palmeri TaxID=231048 RepID=A0A6N8EGJ2_9GAMM|nr:BREX system Lon protease-like protein BrxL [Allochromatium palmeri]MTW21816.1 BREX system Lon protease-like protein BrxL [Allochromatium palmeri]
MNALDQKINTHFPGLVVRKDLVKTVKGNAIVPSYVLEYLLGQYCATSDEASIQTGIETVKEILRKHYVHRNEAGLVRSNIREKGRYKVIDKISVALNEKTDNYEAEFSSLGIKKVLVDSGTVKAHPKLLVSGVWCIADIEYEFAEDKSASPWILSTLKPIQLSHFDFDAYLEARKQFTIDEWIDLLVQSVGFNPELFGKRSKLTQLVRLIPFCERNYNLIELGPKGTGKSHIYSEFSPHGILISGGEVTVPKLFVNNASGKIGLVGYWDVVAFDEFAGKKKRVDKALVDIMKNYMANKSFSRGVETLGAEASMVFVGNTQHTVPYMLKHSDLFDELPDKFYDSAFLDRIHFYIPGWEIDIIRGEMFSDAYGFVVDYLAEILRSLRNHDYSDRYKEHFSLSSDISTRDRDAINKTFSGLMKILYPQDGATKEEIEELLKFSIEGRKRVKDQLMRIDTTYGSVQFSYLDASGKAKPVTTLEEREYSNYYHKTVGGGEEEEPEYVGASEEAGTAASSGPVPPEPVLKEQHLTFQENQKGISFDALLGPYLRGAKRITVTDPYIRLFYQVRNFMELLETIVKNKAPEEEVALRLITTEDEFKGPQQNDHFEKIKDSAGAVGVDFTWEFDRSGTIHARHIVTDHGWKISLDRGLDIFQHYDMNDAFTIANRLQQYRSCKAFEVTFIKSRA